MFYLSQRNEYGSKKKIVSHLFLMIITDYKLLKKEKSLDLTLNFNNNITQRQQ